MIRYDLICDYEHRFEGWFSGSADFEMQRDKGLIECVVCGSTKVDRAIMAPNVSTSRRQEKIASDQSKRIKMVNDVADKIRKEIADNCDNVGTNFAEEARAIHYGEKPERGIYGQATPKQTAELMEEGVGVAPLPDIIAPKLKDKAN
ncbi:MAG: DUF1178 family protein [Maricaulaceae bacterium]